MWDCLHPSDFQLIPDLHHTQQPYVGFASVDSSRPRQVEVVSWQLSASSCLAWPDLCWAGPRSSCTLAGALWAEGIAKQRLTGKLSLTSIGLWLFNLWLLDTSGIHTCTCSPLGSMSGQVMYHFSRMSQEILQFLPYWYSTLCVLFTAFNAHIPAQSSVSRIKNLPTRTVLGQRLK